AAGPQAPPALWALPGAASGLGGAVLLADGYAPDAGEARAPGRAERFAADEQRTQRREVAPRSVPGGARGGRPQQRFARQRPAQRDAEVVQQAHHAAVRHGERAVVGGYHESTAP